MHPTVNYNFFFVSTRLVDLIPVFLCNDTLNKELNILRFLITAEPRTMIWLGSGSGSTFC